MPVGFQGLQGLRLVVCAAVVQDQIYHQVLGSMALYLIGQLEKVDLSVLGQGLPSWTGGNDAPFLSQISHDPALTKA